MGRNGSSSFYYYYRCSLVWKRNFRRRSLWYGVSKVQIPRVERCSHKVCLIQWWIQFQKTTYSIRSMLSILLFYFLECILLFKSFREEKLFLGFEYEGNCFFQILPSKYFFFWLPVYVACFIKFSSSKYWFLSLILSCIIIHNRINLKIYSYWFR